MPTIEEIVIEHGRLLDEHMVLITGIRSDTDIARDKAFEAVADIAWTRLDVRSYTDQRIQFVLDYFSTTLTQWANGVLEDANRYSDGLGTSIRNDINIDLDTWKTNVQQDIDQILAENAALNQWTEDTFNIEIPRIWDEINVKTEEIRANEQDILNEANTARQETAEMASRWREMADTIEDNKLAILEMDYSIYAVKADIYRQIGVEYEGRFANFDERITVAAGDTGAVADRVETLEVSYQDQFAQVQNLERAMIDGDDQLAQQITSLSVGTNTQFDTFQIWHFDANAEGWSGTWNNGYLRISDSTQSPVLNVDASKYRQVRARVRKIGNPTWNAYLQYTGATPIETVPITEPLWSGDIGEITINPSWSGTLTRMTLTLSSGSTSLDYFELDWITVGRPAPGASSADLATERTARITADSAMAALINAIDLKLTTGDGVIGVATDVVEGVKSEIIEDAISGAVTATNEAITAFDARIDNLETGQSVNSSAISTLLNRITIQDGEIEAVNSRIDNFTFDDNDLVTSDVFQALTQRVNVAENDISVVNQSLTTMNSTISSVSGNVSAAQAAAQAASNLAGSKGKVFVQNSAPPTSERLPQNLWIDTTGSANTPKRWANGAWEAVTDKVARDAAAAAAQALAGLGDKADASALTALSQRVTQTEQGLSTQSSNITSLSNSITLVGNNATSAQQAAQAASDLAGSKGKVIIQSSTPAVADRLPQNLWIDTTNNNNTPKRWSSNAWRTVTDKAALDAAAAAQNALNAVALKADASAVQQLASRVTQTENTIVSQTEEFTRLDNSINVVSGSAQNAQNAAQAASLLAGSKGRVFVQNGAPPVAERLPQNLWIDTTGGNNTPKRWNGTAWVAVTDKVATDAKTAADAAMVAVGTKADATYVASVEQRVSQVGNDLISSTNRVTAVENRINNPTTGLNALASSISSVSSTVNSFNGRITAQSESIDALTANLNGSTANTLLRAHVITTPAGARSRIAISARATAGVNDQTAALYIEAGTDGTNSVQILANKFSIVQNISGVRHVPFYVKNGVVYINNGFIENLSVNSLKLANNSVSIVNNSFTAGSVNIPRAVGNDPPFTTIQTLTLNKQRAEPLPLFIGFNLILNGNALSCWIRVRAGSTVIYEGYSSGSFMPVATASGNSLLAIDRTGTTGTKTYTVEARAFGDSCTVNNRSISALNMLK